MPIPEYLMKLAEGAISGAGEEAIKMFQTARKGTLKMLLVFKDPEGKVIHFRLGFDKRETQEACREVYNQIRSEAQKGK